MGNDLAFLDLLLNPAVIILIIFILISVFVHSSTLNHHPNALFFELTRQFLIPIFVFIGFFFIRLYFQ